MTTAKRFSKFQRPTDKDKGRISDRDLDIIAAVLRYRFSPASELVRLVGGNEDVTQRHLRRLWEWEIINRFAFPTLRSHSEFYYYLDNRAGLELLTEHRGFQVHPAALEEIDNNREKDYAQAAIRGQHMQLGFLKHSLQISRFHFMLEMACRKSAGKIALAAWHQGSLLAGHKVEVLTIKSERRAGNEYLWQETDEKKLLPVEPDGLFTLRFPDRPTEQQLAHFFYEADRGTMNSTDMLTKIRAYYHFIKKQQRHKEAFGVHPIRAVLIETTEEQRAVKLMQLAEHPLVSGPGKRAGLFWFCISPLFTDPPSGSPLPRYLAKPEAVLDPIWALPDRTLLGLADVENSPVHSGQAGGP
jgi:hypothetical protein